MKTLTATLALAVGLITAQARAEDYPKMNLKLAHFGPATFVQSGVDKWWAEEIERRSDGKIRIRIFWAGAAGGALEILGLVGSGAIDFGATPQAFYPNELPLTGAPNAVPMVFTDNRTAVAIQSELIAAVPAVQDELKRNNVRPLFFHSLNSYAPLCTRPVATMDNLSGLRIRSFGVFQPALFDAIGAVGVNVLPADIYEGLQRGRLDCGFYSNDLYRSTKLYEVAKHLMSVDFGPSSTWPIWVSEKKWSNEWPESVRTLISEVSREAEARSLAEVKRVSSESLDFIMSQGVKVVEFRETDKLRAAVPDMLEVWRSNMIQRGLGSEADQVLAFWRPRQEELERARR